MSTSHYFGKVYIFFVVNDDGTAHVAGMQAKKGCRLPQQKTKNGRSSGMKEKFSMINREQRESNRNMQLVRSKGHDMLSTDQRRPFIHLKLLWLSRT